jgi:hypothetical protein
VVTLVDQQTVEQDLADDEAAGVGAEVEGGGRAIVVDRIGPEAHQGRRAGDTMEHYQNQVLTSSKQWSQYTHVVRGGPHGRRWR